MYARDPNVTSAMCSQPTATRCRAVVQQGGLCAWNAQRCVSVDFGAEIVKDVAFGSDATAFLLGNGSVCTIGNNAQGQLGHSSQGLKCLVLAEVITAIAAGAYHMLALGASGLVYSWGGNSVGQLGIGTFGTESQTPVRVLLSAASIVSCISAGVWHSTALVLGGGMFVWGDNRYGQLGQSGVEKITVPHLLNLTTFGISPSAVRSVQCGQYSTAFATDSAAFTVGSNNLGQLGRDGFDEWLPRQPTLQESTTYAAPVTYASYLAGYRDCAS